MSTAFNVYYVVSEVSGVKKATLTRNILERNKHVFDALNDNPEVKIYHAQYLETSEVSFKADLEKLTKGIIEWNKT